MVREPRAGVVLRLQTDQRSARVAAAGSKGFGSRIGRRWRWCGSLGQGLSFAFKRIKGRRGWRRRGAKVSGAGSVGGGGGAGASGRGCPSPSNGSKVGAGGGGGEQRFREPDLSVVEVVRSLGQGLPFAFKRIKVGAGGGGGGGRGVPFAFKRIERSARRWRRWSKGFGSRIGGGGGGAGTSGKEPVRGPVAEEVEPRGEGCPSLSNGSKVAEEAAVEQGFGVGSVGGGGGAGTSGKGAGSGTGGGGGGATGGRVALRFQTDRR